MVVEKFDIFKGLVGRDWTFKGCSPGDSNGAWFEHACGYLVRIGPNALVSHIFVMISEHDCERDKEYEEALSSLP